MTSLNVSGITTLQGNLDCGGGIAINGSDAFFNPFSSIDAVNLTNTYINFKTAGASDDWCYLRQIGGVNAYKLAFDFHDDVNDARFCIRRILSTTTPDGISEVFTVDNGNVSCTGILNVGGNIIGSGTGITNLNYNAITNLAYANITGKPSYFAADWNTTLANKPATFPPTMTTIYNKTETNNLLNAKEAILTFSSPLKLVQTLTH